MSNINKTPDAAISNPPSTPPIKSAKRKSSAKKNIVLSEEQKENFNEFLYLCDKYKNSYFWHSPATASARRYIENRDRLDYETEVNGVTYSVHFSVDVSCKHYYVTKKVYRNGEKTNARVISTLLEKAASTASTVA